MPWTAADAPKKLKGKAREKWASIANAILHDCMETRHDEMECAKRAKIIANAKVKGDG